ncbi:MAG: hypothetical protein SCARUB_02622, partial [Candidatus Scalindua rubra]
WEVGKNHKEGEDKETDEATKQEGIIDKVKTPFEKNLETIKSVLQEVESGD